MCSGIRVGVVVIHLFCSPPQTRQLVGSSLPPPPDIVRASRPPLDYYYTLSAGCGGEILCLHNLHTKENPRGVAAPLGLK